MDPRACGNSDSTVIRPVRIADGSPRMWEFREFIVLLPQGPKKILRHSREGGNPQFPRMREFNENTILTGQTPHSCTGLHQRHSREGGNDGVFFSGIGVVGRWNSRMRGNDVEVVLRGNDVFPDS